MTGFKTFWVLCLAAGLLFAASGISKAAIYLTVNGVNTDWVAVRPSDVCVIDIVSDDNSVYDAVVGFDEWADPLGAFVHQETRPEAGNGAGVELWEYGPPFSYGYWVWAFGDPSPGVHFVFLYHAEEFGQVTLGLWDGNFNLVDAVSIIVTAAWIGACCDPAGCYMSEESDCWYTWLGAGSNCSMCEAPLTVISPNGGECAFSNRTYVITWSGGVSISAVLIEYSTNNGLNWNTIVTVPKSGSYNWLVPIVDSNQCLVRISDFFNPSVSDTSDGVFRITDISVTVPNGGECLLPNRNYTIKWPVKVSISAVLIEYSNDNGLNWNNIATVPNSGSYNWLVPEVNSNQCLVRISDATDPCGSDTSDGVFSIGIGLGRYSGGTGVPCNPYRIATAEDLNDVGNHEQDWDKCFILVNDVNLAGYTGTQFSIIGRWISDQDPANKPFTGIFDGNNHKVLNFIWNSTGRNGIGLFASLSSSGQIKNLGMENVNIHAETGNDVGGLVGGNKNGTLTNCYSTGSVSGTYNVGGLVGWNYYCTIESCYSSSSVSGTNWNVGGLTGCNYGTITNCYSTGNVSGTDYVGGLIPLNYGTIRNCYSSSRVWGTNSNVGGLVGCNQGSTITSSFWDTQTSTRSTSAGGTPKTTAEMKTRSTFTDAGWDFVGETVNGRNDVWRMCVDGIARPLLSWQFGVGDFTCPDGVDFIDFAVLASAWLTDPKEPDWKSVCDISQPNDSFIDDFDLVIFCDNWLENTTP